MSLQSALNPVRVSWRSDSTPDVTRAGVGHVLVSRWVASEPMLQRTAAQVGMAALWRAPWPDGLIAHSCLLGEDGLSVLHYSQWAGAETPYSRKLVAAISGADSQDLGAYRLQRSRVAQDDGRRPGCVAIIEFEVDGGAGKAERFVDAMTAPGLPTPRGLLGGHYHVSADGQRVFNYAEWLDLAANRAFLESTERAAFGEVLAASPGVRQIQAALYRPFAGGAAPG